MTGPSPDTYDDLLDHSLPVTAGSLTVEQLSDNHAQTINTMRWPGLLLHTAHLEAQHSITSIPANLEDTFSIGLRGISRLRIRTSRFYDAVMEPGMMMMLPRGNPAVFDQQGLTDLLMLAVEPSLLGNVALEALDMDPAHAELSEHFPLKDGLIAEIGIALIGLTTPHHTADHLYAESLINMLALHTLRRYGVQHIRSRHLRGGLSHAALRLVKDYIREHPGDDLTLAELSRMVNLSAAHFATLFKASTGQSVHQYVLQQRIAEVKRLLTSDALTLAEIAVAVGFADQSHLTRTFKRIVGTTPGALQKRRFHLRRD